MARPPDPQETAERENRLHRMKSAVRGRLRMGEPSCGNNP
jgi:hypothetical protein